MAVSIRASCATPNRRMSAALTRPWAARNPRASARRRASGGSMAHDLLDQTHFHVAVLKLEGRAPPREPDRFLERRRLDQQSAADGLLGLHERPLDDLSTAHGQPGPR